MRLLYLLDEKFSRLEHILIALLLALMVLLAFSQIVLRNLFATGIDWGDSLVRNLVVWVGFVGAAIAAREHKHITIDVLSRWITGSWSGAVAAVSNFSSAAVCGLLTWAGIKFIWFEAEMGGTTFFDFPVWVPELIIPVTFGLMTLRYSLRLISEFTETGPEKIK